MSRPAAPEPQPLTFSPEEEQWFAEYGQQKKRPLRTSPTTPPPPIGDPLADRWFR